MTRLLACLVVALAMFVSPVAMARGVGMPSAQPAAAMAVGECPAMHAPAPEREQKADFKTSCATACAAIPGTPAALRVRAAHAGSQAAPAPVRALHGIGAAYETPPPRIASRT